MKTVFLMISRLLYDKGYNEYIEAARVIRMRYPNTEFQLLGSVDVDYPNHVPESVVLHNHSENIINYLGYRQDVAPIIQKVHCIVHPSFYNEGLSRVLMEALAMGKPIIASNIPGCKETVENGRNGFLIPPRNVDALVRALEAFILMEDSIRKKMGQYSRIKAESEFDVKNVILKYKQITDEVELKIKGINL